MSYNNSSTLGDWTNLVDQAEYAKEFKALVVARTALEAKVRASHPGAVFSYKGGTVKFACPIASEKPRKVNGIKGVDQAALKALLSMIQQASK